MTAPHVQQTDALPLASSHIQRRPGELLCLWAKKNLNTRDLRVLKLQLGRSGTGIEFNNVVKPTAVTAVETKSC